MKPHLLSKSTPRAPRSKSKTQRAHDCGSGQIGRATRGSLRLFVFGNQRIRQGIRSELVAGRVIDQPLIMHLRESSCKAIFGNCNRDIAQILSRSRDDLSQTAALSNSPLRMAPFDPRTTPLGAPETHHFFLIGLWLPI
jgi:hypothetical protein